MIVHKNPYFSIHYKEDYYSLQFPTEQVIVLPIVDESNILFIKAIRPVFDGPVIELPAGTVEPKETNDVAALRELGEETGIRITDLSRLIALPSLNTIPSRTSQMLSIYQIDITKEEYENRGTHDDEIAGTLLLSKEQAVSKIINGEIFVSTIAAICSRHILMTNKRLNYRGDYST